MDSSGTNKQIQQAQSELGVHLIVLEPGNVCCRVHIENIITLFPVYLFIST